MSSVVIFITLCTISLYSIVSTDSALYEEIQQLKASCFPSDYCPAFWYPAHDHMWGDRVCECGTHCVRFGTCCANSIHAGKKYNAPLSPQESCQRLDNFPVPVFMVSKCSSRWKWPADVVRKCEKGEYADGEHLRASVPLTKVGTSTTYRNYYCALCNFGGKDFLYWSVALQLKVPKTAQEISWISQPDYARAHTVYDIKRKSWVIVNRFNTRSYDVSVRHILPSYMQKMVKRCYENLVQTCSPSYKGSQLEKKCQSYYSPITIKGEAKAAYRNVHCALCNGVKPSSVANRNCNIKRIAGRSSDIRPTSFFALIDINRSKGDQAEETRASYCDDGYIYDPYFKKCRKLVCAPIPGMKLVKVDGKWKCVMQKE